MNPAGGSDSKVICSFKAEVVGPSPTHRALAQGALNRVMGAKIPRSGPAARAVDAKQNKNGIRRTDGPAPVSGLAPERRRDGFCKSSKNDKQIYTY